MDFGLLRPLGRTLTDDKRHLFCMDWSASGFDILFDCGGKAPAVNATFTAIAMEEPSGHFADPSVTPYPIWPRIAVFLDDFEHALGTFMIDQGEKTIRLVDPNERTILPVDPDEMSLLPMDPNETTIQSADTDEMTILPADVDRDSPFTGPSEKAISLAGQSREDGSLLAEPDDEIREADSPGSAEGTDRGRVLHRLRVIKLTENVKCGLALKDISVNGRILPFQVARRPLLEVIGDSITCGFGNLTQDGKALFLSEEEDIRYAYAYLTAQRLGMDVQIIGSSGFCLDMKEWTGRPYCIDEMYEYTDRPRQEMWDDDGQGRSVNDRGTHNGFRQEVIADTPENRQPGTCKTGRTGYIRPGACKADRPENSQSGSYEADRPENSQSGSYEADWTDDCQFMRSVPGKKPEHWDFASHPASIVVLNIGTNDGNGVNYAADPYAAEEKFREDYLAFIRKLRRLNGPKTRIVCALGDMEYFLFDDIRAVYEEYKKETGDPYVYLLKLRGMRPGEPRGAGNHPSRQTHERFARELTEFIRKNIMQDRDDS